MKILKWVRDRNIISLNLAGTVAIRVQGIYWGGYPGGNLRREWESDMAEFVVRPLLCTPYGV